MDGILNIYYPCKIKNSFIPESFNRLWKQYRKRQLAELYGNQYPLTDLMDKKEYRDMYNHLLLSVIPKHYGHIKGAPYATECLRMEYEKSRESKLESKELSFVVSTFDLDYLGITQGTPYKSVCGSVLFHLNLENFIGTYIVVLNFSGLSVNEIIMLKHIFYKRTHVNIRERKQRCCSPPAYYEGCRDCAMNITTPISPNSYTFPEYIQSLSLGVAQLKKLNVDYRARYSFLEIGDEYNLSDAELYGLLCADECYNFANANQISDALSKNASTRISYEIYNKRENTLVVNHSHVLCCEVAQANQFLAKLAKHKPCDDVEVVNKLRGSCIAGVGKRYTQYLRTVEIHYLINSVTINEIRQKRISYWNPIVFLQRGKQLWDILYDMETNKSHLDDKYLETFEITRRLHELKEEHRTIMNHTFSYMAAIFTVVTIICSIIQICLAIK